MESIVVAKKKSLPVVGDAVSLRLLHELVDVALHVRYELRFGVLKAVRPNDEVPRGNEVREEGLIHHVMMPRGEGAMDDTARTLDAFQIVCGRRVSRHVIEHDDDSIEILANGLDHLGEVFCFIVAAHRREEQPWRRWRSGNVSHW